MFAVAAPSRSSRQPVETASRQFPQTARTEKKFKTVLGKRMAYIESGTSVNEHSRAWVYLRKPGPVADTQTKTPR